MELAAAPPPSPEPERFGEGGSPRVLGQVPGVFQQQANGIHGEDDLSGELSAVR
jgi:hypothetical protein